MQTEQLKHPHRKIPLLPLLLGLSIAILASVVLSACIGVAGSSLSAVWESLTNFDPNSTVHQVIRELRLPRAVGAVLIGAALALSGAIMQGIGNNPLADTGLLGINAGAGFLVSISMVVFSAISFHWVMACAFLGACLGAVLTYGFGTAKGRNTAPLRLLLAGSAVSALFNAISQGISLCFGLAKDLSFWQSGSLSGLTWNQIYIAIPWMLLAMVAGLLLGPVLSILALGQESATGLGVSVKYVQILGMIISLILAGSCVAIAGGISFVGLMVPHIARFLVGTDYRKNLPVSLLSGSLLMVLADVSARMLNAPYDTPVGALVSVLGVPFFLALTYQKRKRRWK